MTDPTYDDLEAHREVLQQLARVRASIPGAEGAPQYVPRLDQHPSAETLDRHARRLVNDVLAIASMADDDGRYWEFATLGSMLAGGCVSSSSRSWMSAARELVVLADRLDIALRGTSRARR